MARGASLRLAGRAGSCRPGAGAAARPLAGSAPGALLDPLPDSAFASRRRRGPDKGSDGGSLVRGPLAEDRDSECAGGSAPYRSWRGPRPGAGRRGRRSVWRVRYRGEVGGEELSCTRGCPSRG